MTDMNNDLLDDCGCAPAAEPSRDNAPGQPAIAFRAGTHGSFLARMTGRISSQRVDGVDAPPLAGLTTRETDDPTIALMDAAAVVADVLTFYTERIANEQFLRTATERLSVLELTRAIGYELRPGVAASAFLAFEVEDAQAGGASALVDAGQKDQGVLTRATIPIGLKVMSVPKQDEKPQVFETIETVEARATWNKLAPLLAQPQVVDIDDPKLLFFVGTNTGLRQGDVIVIADPDETSKARAHRVQRVQTDAKRDRTRVDFAAVPQPVSSYQSPFFQLIALSANKVTLSSGAWTSLFMSSKEFPRALSQQLTVSAMSESQAQAIFKYQDWEFASVAGQQPPPKILPPPEKGVFALRQRLGFFGHNAPRWESLPLDPNPPPVKRAGYANNWDGVNARAIWEDSQGTDYTGFDAFLERVAQEITDESWVVFDVSENPLVPLRVKGTTEASLADFGISGKAMGLKLANPDGTAVTKTGNNAKFLVRRTTALAHSERLDLADLPIEDDFVAGETVIPLDRLVFGLAPGRVVMLSGERADLRGIVDHEALTLADVVHTQTNTILMLKTGLAKTYVRETVTLNANVALATHGETVGEVLGSGDAAKANPSFVLKRPPLTYISSSASASGAASTLTVRVNDISWREAESLLDSGPKSEDYIVRIGDDGKATLTFGDGVRGSRLPSGQLNVRATYRSGIGPEGEVKAGSLTMLMSRPLGVRGVTNPLDATGSAAPETRDDARTNAPTRVLTLDRVVSLKDYEDFAASFSGVGKAQATQLWRNGGPTVFVTVASASGKPLATSDPLLNNLRDAIAQRRDPRVPVRVSDHEALPFNISAELRRDSRYLFDDVREAADAALQAAFGFSARALGQPVTAAEVMAVLQGVAGVVMVDLNALDVALGDTTPTPNAVLPAERARLSDDGATMLPAQLLFLAPLGVELKEKP